MTDMQSDAPAVERSVHTGSAAQARLSRRYAAERRFRYLGLGAVLLACSFLVLLLSTVVGKGVSAFTYHYMTLPLELTGDDINTEVPRRSNFGAIIRRAMDDALPFVDGRRPKRTARALVSGSADVLVSRQVNEDPDLIGGTRQVALPVSDTMDLYLKGLIVAARSEIAAGEARPTDTIGEIEILTASNSFALLLRRVREGLADQAEKAEQDAAGLERSISRMEAELEGQRRRLETAPDRERVEANIAKLEADVVSLNGRIERHKETAKALLARASADNRREALGADNRSYLVHINGGVVKATAVDNNNIAGTVLIPLQNDSPASEGTWSIETIELPESSRQVSDREIVYMDYLDAQGLIERRFNWLFFTTGASREPEMAGIWGAVVGSALTMLVTLMMSFPLGVAAAIYLEEFAPKNRWTQVIEVNINNLAAVPSIVFGLLGLAVFLNFFGMPRSAPVVGGMVLALMTLPTIIIASRAALKAVPPSIREAALGIGASKIQSVFHHVLPLAMPGILTGTIIGMAQALGETAPLLMIGMVAFIVDIPGGFTDPATVLPVQIYMWADFPEQAFQQKTAAAILVLLGFLIMMNAVAVLMRRRFERRW